MDYLYRFWQMFTFWVAHKVTLWMLLLLFGVVAGEWILSNILAGQVERGREAATARRMAKVYAAMAIGLWALGEFLT